MERVFFFARVKTPPWNDQTGLGMPAHATPIYNFIQRAIASLLRIQQTLKVIQPIHLHCRAVQLLEALQIVNNGNATSELTSNARMTTLDNPLPVYLAQPNHLVLHKDEMAGKFLNVVIAVPSLSTCRFIVFLFS